MNRIVAGNWKMHLGPQAGYDLAVALANRIPDLQGIEVVVAPPFISLAAVRQGLQGSHIKLAAQNDFWEKQGAFTGEVSAAMLREAGCQYVIIGHSERRQLFGETDVGVNRKVCAALNNGLVPIVCVGETLAERDGGETAAVLERQVTRALLALTTDDIKRLVFAYEPVWAIGTGRAANVQMAVEVAVAIRDLVKGLFPDSDSIPVLYGGSVNPENAAQFASRPEISGALVGGASLQADAFTEIVRAFYKER